jgi:hypothetical protein
MSGFDGTDESVSIGLKAQVARDTLMSGLKMDNPISGDRRLARGQRRRRAMLTKHDEWQSERSTDYCCHFDFHDECLCFELPVYAWQNPTATVSERSRLRSRTNRCLMSKNAVCLADR